MRDTGVEDAAHGAGDGGTAWGGRGATGVMADGRLGGGGGGSGDKDDRRTRMVVLDRRVQAVETRMGSLDDRCRAPGGQLALTQEELSRCQLEILRSTSAGEGWSSDPAGMVTEALVCVGLEERDVIDIAEQGARIVVALRNPSLTRWAHQQLLQMVRGGALGRCDLGYRSSPTFLHYERPLRVAKAILKRTQDGFVRECRRVVDGETHMVLGVEQAVAVRVSYRVGDEHVKLPVTQSAKDYVVKDSTAAWMEVLASSPRTSSTSATSPSSGRSRSCTRRSARTRARGRVAPKAWVGAALAPAVASAPVGWAAEAGGPQPRRHGRPRLRAAMGLRLARGPKPVLTWNGEEGLVVILITKIISILTLMKMASRVGLI